MSLKMDEIEYIFLYLNPSMMKRLNLSPRDF
jgi:hypothetical protein